MSTAEKNEEILEDLTNEPDVSDNEEELFYCDVCGDNVSKKWYHKALNGDCFDCCVDCVGNIKFEQIDRTSYSTDDKPVIWPCLSCKKKMGGGHKWYTFDTKLDLCLECHDSGKITECLDLVDYSVHKYTIIERSHPLIVCCDASEKNIEGEYESFGDYIDSLVYYEYNCNESINNWKIFVADRDDDWGYPASCGFLINIKGGQIASYVIDDHGRISIDKAYENIQEYQSDFETWQKNRLPDDEINKIKNSVKECFHNGGTCEDDLICQCVDFPIYFRVNKGLDMYYG